MMGNDEMTTASLFTPSHVANFLLEKAECEKIRMTPLKLLKLVYLSYGWVRAVLDKRLFDEPIEAWKLGPVTPSLYHEFKRFANNPITGRSISMDENGATSICSIPSSHQETILVIEKCWDVYKPFTASALVNKTHEPDTPWAKYYKPHTDIKIPDEEIKAYFVKKIGEYMNAASR